MGRRPKPSDLVGTYLPHALDRLTHQYGMSRGNAKAFLRQALAEAKASGVIDRAGDARILVSPTLRRQYGITEPIVLIWNGKKVITVVTDEDA